MTTSTSELWAAAAALDMRLQILRAPRFKLPRESWTAYDRRFGDVVPEWYKELLAEFAFLGVYLELPNYRDNSWATVFSFRSPIHEHFDGYDDEELTPHGWFPFAEEADGNLWAFKSLAPPDSPIVLLDHSAGGIETEAGFIYGAHCLAHLLSIAAVSNGRFEHLKEDGFVDLTKSGYKIWGDFDAFMEAKGIETKEELKNRARRQAI